MASPGLDRRNQSAFDMAATLNEADMKALMARIGAEGISQLERWEHRARPEQLPPPGDWQIWLVMAGRGFGKTRMGAEWVRSIAEQDGSARIALIGASLHEARAVMVEGESGLLAVAPHWLRPVWKPYRRQLHWPNGASATIYGAADAETLRGPQHSHVRRQAQKELTHNEALQALDLLVQPVVLSAGLSAPPASPALGACWIVAAAPAGDWAGHGGDIAQWTAGGWRFAQPSEGWRCHVLDQSGSMVHDGGGWREDAVRADGFYVAGTRVVGPQHGAIAVPSGGAVIDSEARAGIAAILGALQAHGLIA